ncbi:MAG: hypothetical protein O3B65_00875 [Chloroflexi bacterium]|nr:hypothetical protein [Chloroflexota bacterium]
MSAGIFVQAAAALIAVASIVWLSVSTLRRRSMRNAGYGIAALRTLDHGQRNVSAEIVRVPDLANSWDAGLLVERSFTVVTIPHTGHVANAVAYRGADADDVDDESLSQIIPEWHGGGVGSATGIDLDALSFVRGFVAVEPEQIRYVEAGDLLEPDYLREVVERLVGIGERLEQDALAEQPAA